MPGPSVRFNIQSEGVATNGCRRAAALLPGHEKVHLGDGQVEVRRLRLLPGDKDVRRQAPPGGPLLHALRLGTLGLGRVHVCAGAHTSQ